MALRLHWPDERYVRIYCRDTIDWSALSWSAQALYMQLNRKADRRGYIGLGRIGRRGIAVMLGRADLWPVLEPALAELEADGCVVVDGDVLKIPDFVESQEAVSSGKARQRKYLEGQKIREEEASRGDEASPLSDEASEIVTRGYGTARRSKEGTGQHGISSGTSVEATAPHCAPPVTGDALSAAFAAELDEETNREDKRRARVLGALDGWRTVADVAALLKRTSPRSVEHDLVELRSRGLVEREERGSPAAPVMHWRRVGAA